MITHADLARLGRLLRRCIVGPLEERVAALESQQRGLAYRGGFGQERHYIPGDFVSHNGCIWHCNKVCSGLQPGSEPAGEEDRYWTLAVLGRPPKRR